MPYIEDRPTIDAATARNLAWDFVNTHCARGGRLDAKDTTLLVYLNKYFRHGTVDHAATREANDANLRVILGEIRAMSRPATAAA